MAQMSGPAQMPVQDMTIDHGGAANAGAERQKHDVRCALGRAQPALAKQSGARVVQHWNGFVPIEPLAPIKAFETRQAARHGTDRAAVGRRQTRSGDTDAGASRTTNQNTPEGGARMIEPSIGAIVASRNAFLCQGDSGWRKRHDFNVGATDIETDKGPGCLEVGRRRWFAGGCRHVIQRLAGTNGSWPSLTHQPPSTARTCPVVNREASLMK